MNILEGFAGNTTLRDIQAAQARKSLWYYCCLTSPDFYNDGKPHLKVLCDTLQDFYEEKLLKNDDTPYFKLMIRMPPQFGKLLPHDTPILTTNGWKKHGDLEVGDFVFGQDGKPKAVLGNSGVYKWGVRTITFNDGIQIKASKEHLWKLRVEYDDKKGRRDAIMETQDIFNKKHRRRPYIDVSPSLDFPHNQNLLIDPYTLGCWLGDGNSNDGNITCWVIDAYNYSNIGDVKDIKNRPTVKRIKLHSVYNGEPFRTTIKRLNLYKNKHIPIEYLLSSHEQRMALLNGLMDTDGYCGKHGDCEFSQMESQLAEDVQVLLRSLGYKSRSKTYDAKLNGKYVGRKVRIGFSPNKGERIFRLARKQYYVDNKKRGDRSDKYKYFIKDISKNDEVVYGNCISVEGEMYLAGKELIPTHNSRTLVNAAKWMFGRNKNERVITGSYGDAPATEFSRYTRDGIMEEKNLEDDFVFSDIFPDVRVKKTDASVQKWALEGEHFSYLGVGVGGAVTGKGATIRIVDDLIKDAEQAMNDTALERAWLWFSGTFSSRTSAKGGIAKEIFCATLWGERDPQKILEDTEGDDWYVLSMPAYNEETGEMLCEEIMSKEAFFKLKARMLVDSRSKMIFYANYMCEAIDDNETKVFPRSSLKTYREIPTDVINENGKDVRREMGWVFAFADTADEGNDYFAMPIFRVIGSSVYLIDCIFDQHNLTIQEMQVKVKIKQHKIRKVVIETNNAGAYFVRRCKVLNPKVEFYGQYSKANKMSRIQGMSGIIKYNYYFPENPNADVSRFMKQVFRLLKTSKKEDDAPDALAGSAFHLENNYKIFD